MALYCVVLVASDPALAVSVVEEDAIFYTLVKSAHEVWLSQDEGLGS